MAAWIPVVVAVLGGAAALGGAWLTYRNGRGQATLANQQAEQVREETRIQSEGYYRDMARDLQVQVKDLNSKVERLEQKVEQQRVAHDEQMRELVAAHEREKIAWQVEVQAVRTAHEKSTQQLIDAHTLETARLNERAVNAERRAGEAEANLKRANEQIAELGAPG